MARSIGLPWQFFNDSGAVLASGTLEFFDPGTSNYKTVYKNAAESSEHTQPITLDSSGRPPSDIFLKGMYDVTLKDSSGSTIESISDFHDWFTAVGTDLNENLLSNHSFETAGTGGEPFANWTETDSGTVISRDTSDQYHGAASALFTSSSSSSDFITSDAFEISPGKDVALSFYLKTNNAACKPKVDINWLDSSQADISTSTLYHGNVGLTPTSWALEQGYRSSPPATGRYAKLIIYGNTDASSYNTNIDGVSISQVASFANETPYTPFGLELSRDSGDTSHDINVTAGSVKSDDFTDDLVLDNEITKQMDVAFSEGDDSGGDDGSGLPASGIYYVWLIKDSSTGHVDVLGSTSATAPTMPSGYDVKRLIGAWYTDGSNNFVDGAHKGTIFEFFSAINDISDSSMTDSTFETATVSVPPECRGFFTAWWNHDTVGPAMARVHLRHGDSSATGSETHILKVDDDTGIDEIAAQAIIGVNSSSQIDYAVGDDSSGAISGTFTMYTWGFDMLTRNAP